MGVLIERAHYYAILAEEGRTNREGCTNRGSTVFFYSKMLEGLLLTLNILYVERYLPIAHYITLLLIPFESRT